RRLSFSFLDRGEPVSVTLAQKDADAVRLSASGEPLDRARVLSAARRVLDLDADLGEFHGACAAGADGFEWIAARGAGRMLRAPTVFEDAVKVLATTNCTWAVTRNISAGLVALAGRGGAFPDAEIV